MSNRMLLLNTALAGVQAVKVGVLLTILTFLMSFIAIEFWPQAGRLTFASWRLGYWAIVVAALVMLVIHHQQMPDWRRAVIGVAGLHLPICLGGLLLFLSLYLGRFGGVPSVFLEAVSLAIFIGASMAIGMVVWWVTRLVVGRTFVVSQMECVYCDYSLTGLTSMVCPECGNEILEAIDSLGTGQSVPVSRVMREGG